MIRCDDCGKTFKTAQGLAGHRQLVHARSQGSQAEAPPGEGEAADDAKEKALVVSKPQPVEVLIHELQLPQVVDGTREVFDAGVEYGMKSILIGVRIAQELSAMGVQQARPLLEMAKEMRAAEGQAAQVAAQDAAEQAAARVAQYFEGKKPDIAMAPDPFKGLAARLTERLMDGLLDRLLPGGGEKETLPQGWVHEREEGGNV